jgi:hypothetical protein
MGMVMRIVLVCGALATSGACGDEEHYPPGGDPGPAGGSGGGSGGDEDDDPAGEVAVLAACQDFAQDRCAGALACDLDSLVRGPDDVSTCYADMASYCFQRRTAPVSTDDLEGCTDAIAEQECTADLPVPQACSALWDTTPLDAGSPDAGSPDAGSPDAGSPDAGSPDAGSPDAGS